MIVDDKEIKKKFGIYSIKNILNGKMYIGSSVDLYLRKNTHFKQLFNMNHHSIYLQNAYNKYGIDNLVFDIIEFVPNKIDLIKREQMWIDLLKPEYNIYKIAGSPLGYKHTEESKEKIRKNSKLLVHSEETKLKISNAKKGVKKSQESIDKVIQKITGRKLSEEHKNKIGKAHLGRKNSIETIIKMKNAHSNVSVETRQKMRNAQINGKGSNAKIVLNLENGVFYETIKDAWKSYGVKSMGNFQKRLSKGHKNDILFRLA
jgi:group I intron endonuclease